MEKPQLTELDLTILKYREEMGLPNKQIAELTGLSSEKASRVYHAAKIKKSLLLSDLLLSARLEEETTLTLTIQELTSVFLALRKDLLQLARIDPAWSQSNEYVTERALYGNGQRSRL